MSAQVEDREGNVRLVFRNGGRAGAVFHVYDKLKLDAMPSRQPIPADPNALLAFRDRQYPQPRRFMVEPNRHLKDEWAVQGDNAGRYDLWVLGPNGFHRRFRGDLTALRPRHSSAPEVRLSYEPRAGGIRLEARNEGGGPVVLKVRSNKLYGALTAVGSRSARATGTTWEIKLTDRDEQTLFWNLDSTGWWYDLIVTSDADPSFLRRLAGRMETGRHSVSDPGMGLADSF